MASDLSEDDTTIEWSWQIRPGTEFKDSIHVDSGVIMVGATEGSFDPDYNAKGNDFAACALDPDNGEELWRWQLAGTRGEDFLAAVVAVSDNKVVFSGTTSGDVEDPSAPTRNTRFVAVAIDPTEVKDEIWKFEDDVLVEESSLSSVLTSDGETLVLSGMSTTANYQTVQFRAVGIDVDSGEEKWSFNTQPSDTEGVIDVPFTSVAVDDGTVLLAGMSMRDSTADLYVLSLDPRLDEDQETNSWRSKSAAGTVGALRAGVQVGDTAVFAGHTDGDFAGKNAGGEDVIAVALNANLEELWKWQGGSHGNDNIHDIARLNDNTVVLVGSTNGAYSRINHGGNDFLAIGLDAHTGEELFRWQDGTSYDEKLTAVSVLDENSVFLTGGSAGAFGTAQTSSSSENWAWSQDPQGGLAPVGFLLRLNGAPMGGDAPVTRAGGGEAAGGGGGGGGGGRGVGAGLTAGACILAAAVLGVVGFKTYKRRQYRATMAHHSDPQGTFV